MDDYNEKNEGAREALTSVARMARISVRSRSLTYTVGDADRVHSAACR
jgi:hypothetical protein